MKVKRFRDYLSVPNFAHRSTMAQRWLMDHLLYIYFFFFRLIFLIYFFFFQFKRYGFLKNVGEDGTWHGIGWGG